MLKSFHVFSNYFIEASVKITAMMLRGKRSLPLMSAKKLNWHTCMLIGTFKADKGTLME